MLPEKKFFRRINVIPLVQSCLKKYSVSRPPKSNPYFAYPVPDEGRFAIVTDVGAGCGGHGGTLTNGADVDGEVVWS
jgi:hypothetical protein